MFVCTMHNEECHLVLSSFDPNSKLALVGCNFFSKTGVRSQRNNKYNRSVDDDICHTCDV